jgi:hypothetical protein
VPGCRSRSQRQVRAPSQPRDHSPSGASARKRPPGATDNAQVSAAVPGSEGHGVPVCLPPARPGRSGQPGQPGQPGGAGASVVSVKSTGGSVPVTVPDSDSFVQSAR